jgi:TPR repeat protein/peptidoglycan hydrolase-like protein with peptidoglycan-binding domain
MSKMPARAPASRPLLPNLLVGAIVVVTVVAALVAVFTIEPSPRLPRHAKAPADFAPGSAARPTGLASASGPALAAAPAFANDLSLAPVEASPGPTSADVARNEAAPRPSGSPAYWKTLPIDQLRERANANEGPAMEELARRLLGGRDITPDPPAAAGWMMRAAELGSPQAAFSVGVMYERGFVVERNSTRAAQWYRRAADAGLAVAKHNLALLLRDGKGVPRDGPQALELLHAAARQGMAASMFSLGDMYEQGDAAPKDAVAALAWFAITEEFERQVNHGSESTLEKTAAQRAQALKRTATPAELQRAEQLGQDEFHQIVVALTPVKAAPKLPAAPAPAESAETAAPSSSGSDSMAWPKDAAGQVRAIQQMLVELKLLRGKPDGLLGPMTRAALRDFQRSAGLSPSGEPSKEVFSALAAKRATYATSKGWTLPPPQSAAIANDTPAAPANIDLGKSEPPPPPPSTAEIARDAPKRAGVEPPAAPVVIDLGRSEPTPPPTSAEIAAMMPRASPATAPPSGAGPVKRIDPPPPPSLQVDASRPPAMTPPPALPDKPRSAAAELPKAGPSADAWPNAPVDQIKVIQMLLRDLRFYHGAPTGRVDAATRTAIRDYQRMAGLKETGDTGRALFDSLKEMRAMMAPKRD